MAQQNIPVIMMPLAQAREHGMEIERAEGEENKSLSKGYDLKFDILGFAKIAEELGVDEDDWIDVVLNNRLLRMYYSPLKKYRGKRFDGFNYRNILTRHRVVPCMMGKKIYLLGVDYLTKVFGLSIIIDFLWDFHEINYYFDFGKRDVVEPMEIEEEARLEPLNTKDRDIQALLDLVKEKVE